ncbi:MAG: DNA repair protein RecN [Phycisphaerae bacterium]
MLKELHIQNLAVIADARIELLPGLNCFTGATGAGKSLVIGAINVLLGLRSAGELLRSGAEEGRVTGLFELRDGPLLAELSRELDMPLQQEGGEVLLVRRLFASGRTSVSLNGQPITLAMLKRVGELLVDVHGQHDHQFLLKPQNQLETLDAFAGLAEARAAFGRTYAQLREAHDRLAELTAGRNLRDQQLDLLRFQADEIDAAELDAAEFAELEARSSVLENLEKLKKDAGSVHSAIYEADGSILERMKMAAAILSELAELDPSLKETAQNVHGATLQLEDAAYDIGRYVDRLDLDPEELAEVTERLNTINRVLRKYGNDIESTLSFRRDVGRQMQELQRATEDFSGLQAQIEPLANSLAKQGRELTTARRAAAAKLGPLIQSQLAELGMGKATFAVQLSTGEYDWRHATPAGFDQVEFVAKTNPGLPEQPLRRIASGGEMSRIMLALKGTLAAGDRVSVLVFDEIDANVGGRLGSVIGDKLRGLARYHQVLCITHLPQIAAYAERHLTVRKEQDEATTTSVRQMLGEDRVQEIAEMIGGQRVTATTLAQAKELLETASAGQGEAAETASVGEAAGAKKKPRTGRARAKR